MEGSLSEVGITPPHNSDTPNALMAAYIKSQGVNLNSVLINLLYNFLQVIPPIIINTALIFPLELWVSNPFLSSMSLIL